MKNQRSKFQNIIQKLKAYRKVFSMNCELITRNYQSGQSLIEVVIALAAAIIIVTAITSIVLNALSNAQHSKSQNLATAYAQEGTEVLKRMKESNWSAFDGVVNGTYCMRKSNPTNFPNEIRNGSNCDRNIESFYVREVDIRKFSDNCTYQDANGATQKVTEATVTVKWNDGKCKDAAAQNQYCRKVTMFSCLTNLQSVPPL